MKMLFHILLLWMVMETFEITKAAKRQARLEVHSYECTNHSGIIKQFYCKLRKLDISTYAFDTFFELRRDFPANAEIHAQIQVKMPMGNKILNFLDLRVNICDGLDRAMAIPITRDLIIEMRRVSNLPYACPIKSNTVYTMNNFTVSTANLPTYTPAFIKFNYSMKYYSINRLLGNSLTQGSTVLAG